MAIPQQENKRADLQKAIEGSIMKGVPKTPVINPDKSIRLYNVYKMLKSSGDDEALSEFMDSIRSSSSIWI